MKKLTITDEMQPVTKEELLLLAKELDIVIPEDYMSFMMLYGGGVGILENLFDGRLGINGTLRTESKRNPSIRSIFETYRLEMHTKNWLPFAIDGGGWVFCYSISPETMGQIYIDRFDSGEEPPHEFLAQTLEEFVDKLAQELD
jgi:hypothetical protein